MEKMIVGVPTPMLSVERMAKSYIPSTTGWDFMASKLLSDYEVHFEENGSSMQIHPREDWSIFAEVWRRQHMLDGWQMRKVMQSIESIASFWNYLFYTWTKSLAPAPGEKRTCSGQVDGSYPVRVEILGEVMVGRKAVGRRRDKK